MRSMPIYVILCILLLLLLMAHEHIATQKVIKKFGFVRVFKPTSGSLGEIWDRYTNSEGVKYMQSIASGETASALRSRRPQKTPLKRIYSWDGDNLMITFNMTSLSNPTCTRLVPPLSWLSMTGAKIKVKHSSKDGLLFDIEDENSSLSEVIDARSVIPMESVVKIAVKREDVQARISVFRAQGFADEDLYRMFDKGPWVLAFSPKAIPKLFGNLLEDIGFNRSEAVHIVSHCPYLIAQYARYSGRDVFATARALIDCGYDGDRLVQNCMRFPSMLAAPPDRIRGWRFLLQKFAVAQSPTLFSKFLQKASFMFYTDPPSITDEAEIDYFPVSNLAYSSTEGYVCYNALRILRLLESLGLDDIDKVVRTQPFLLLAEEPQVVARIIALKSIFADCEEYGDLDRKSEDGEEEEDDDDNNKNNNDDDDDDDGTNGDDFIRPQLGSGITSGKVERESRHTSGGVMRSLQSLVSTYPSVLSIDHAQIRSVSSALRYCGLRRLDVMRLVRRFPPILTRSPDVIKVLFELLKERCGLEKSELIDFVTRHPHLVGENIGDLESKINYFYKSLGGTPSILSRYPGYLACDLNKLIRPRAEFLMAVGYDPLFKGVKFLVNSDIDEFTSSVGVQKDAFEQFKVKLESVWISDKDVIGVGKSSKLNSNNLNATLSDSSKAELVDLFASVLDAT